MGSINLAFKNNYQSQTEALITNSKSYQLVYISINELLRLHTQFKKINLIKLKL